MAKMIEDSDSDSSTIQRLSSKEGVGRARETYEARVKALGMEEVLRIVMLLVGKGHHVFLATVCKEWQEHYSAAYPSLETSLPSVVESVKCVRWAKKECGYELSVSTFEAAAEYGAVSVCEELYRMGCAWDGQVCEAAVRNSRHGLRVLKWLRSEDLPTKKRCPWLEYKICGEAGKCGNVELLQWLLSDELEDPPHFNMWSEAVKVGRISVLEILVQHPKVRAQMETTQEGDNMWRLGPFCAAEKSNLEVLQWLHANARELCNWDQHVSCRAVSDAKSLSMLQWLRSEEVMCPWNTAACPQFLKNAYGYWWDMAPAALEEMKEWVHANGHPCDCQD